MDLLPTHEFITSCISQQEYIGFLSCIDLPNIDTFNFTMSKKSPILAPVSSEKSLEFGSCETHSGNYMLSKILIYT